MGTEQDILQCENAVFVENEAYHLISHDEISPAKIDNIMLIASVAWHALAALIKADTSAQVLSYLRTGKAPPELFLEVIVGAFDGEGYLHWSNRRSLPKGER